eukprot:CAMPEP_0178639796 /NCGR_PEP_ID=MMETSP0698-20121128/15661_1 /TAXON_ID=265572 /ORGANISM="Extubocellulus spinifer, Strain CCMP396" /LENGTH=536 /DNA_ID=CAMNT_0020280167 /DNA_START=338 /DNA_END=1948 /DNA_ORIENTATION=-
MDPRQSLGPDVLRQLNLLREAHASTPDSDSDDDSLGGDIRPPPPPIAPPGELTLQRLLSKSPVPWSDVLSRLKTHPTEASLYGYHNQSPLQRCLIEEDPPVPHTLVLALIKAHPASTSDVDSEGRSALYYAAYYKRDGKIVKSILDASPEMVNKATAVGTMPLHVAYTRQTARLISEAYIDVVKMRDSDGEIPLHGAASWGDAGSVQVLLDAGRQCYVGGRSGASGALVCDARGKTPLDRACELVVATSERVGEDLRWGAGRGGGLRQSFVYRRMPMDGNTALREIEGEAMDNWRKLELLAMEASAFVVGVAGELKTRGVERYTQSTTDNIPTLHAAVALALPPEIIWHAANMNQAQVVEPDSMGRRPVHYAAQSISRRRRREEACSLSSATEVMDILLHSNTFGSIEAAGTFDRNKRLPLHYAVEVGADYHEGLGILINACPQALEARDPRSRLFPFALAAATNEGDDQVSKQPELERPDHLGSDARKFDQEQIRPQGSEEEVSNQVRSSSVDTIYRMLREAPTVLVAQLYSNKK